MATIAPPRIILRPSKRTARYNFPPRMAPCKCGCGLTVRGKRVFINKEHQLEWMLNGGARELNALMPDAARALGGQISGRKAVSSGRQPRMAAAGGKRSRELAERSKALRSIKKPQ